MKQGNGCLKRASSAYRGPEQKGLLLGIKRVKNHPLGEAEGMSIKTVISGCENRLIQIAIQMVKLQNIVLLCLKNSDGLFLHGKMSITSMQLSMTILLKILWSSLKKSTKELFFVLNVRINSQFDEIAVKRLRQEVLPLAI